MSDITVVVGLGNIGAAIATRIADRGFPTTGVDPAAERRQSWSRPHSAVGTIAELDWAAVARIVIVVRTTGQALDVISDCERRGAPGLPIHVLTTLEVAAAQTFASRTTGSRLLEQPVSGGASGAREGSLTVMSAGPAHAADLDFLLDTIAARVVAFDRYGDPTLAKLVNNAAAAYNTRAAAVLLALARRLGLDPARMKTVLDHSSGASMMAGMLAELADDQAALLIKDAGLLMAAAGPLPAIRIDDPALFAAEVRTARELLEQSGSPRHS